MLHELPDVSDNQSLKMDKSKTKVIMENHTPIYVNHTQIKTVESKIYTLLEKYRKCYGKMHGSTAANQLP